MLMTGMDFDGLPNDRDGRRLLVNQMLERVQQHLDNPPPPLPPVEYPPELSDDEVIDDIPDHDALLALDDEEDVFEMILEEDGNINYNLDDPCPVCLVRVPNASIDCCSHRYCRGCITRISRIHNRSSAPRCSICRRDRLKFNTSETRLFGFSE